MLEGWGTIATVAGLTGGAVAGLVGSLLLKAWLPSYLAQKGKNVADKEDIKHLTQLVEEVKLQSTMTVEQFKASHQLRLAALDMRLQVGAELPLS